MNATWRLPQVQAAFRVFLPQFPPGVAFDEDATTMEAALQTSLGRTHVVVIAFSNYRLSCVHNPTTGLLEHVLLLAPRR